MKNILTNAFSIQMIANLQRANAIFEKVSASDIPTNIESAIGHADCARICSSILHQKIEMNRVSLSLDYGDVVYVAQFVGGRLPEGATSLPEGITLQFYRVTVKEVV